MELANLAAKQKRLIEWLRFAEEEPCREDLRKRIVQKVTLYQSALARCWEANAITPHDEAEIADLERELEQLNEEARLSVGIPPHRRTA